MPQNLVPIQIQLDILCALFFFFLLSHYVLCHWKKDKVPLNQIYTVYYTVFEEMCPKKKFLAECKNFQIKFSKSHFIGWPPDSLSRKSISLFLVREYPAEFFSFQTLSIYHSVYEKTNALLKAQSSTWTIHWNHFTFPSMFPDH